MEYLSGGSLGDRVREFGLLGRREAASIGATLADALAAIHELGLVHGDVAPDNILIRGDRTVLVDFGLQSGADEPTGPRQRLGSPAFSAPERLRGAPPTAASDVWSLAATLYVLVEGTMPFGPVDLRALRDQEELVLAPFRRAGVLSEPLRAALELEPGARPSAAELSGRFAQLHAKLDGLPPAPGSWELPDADDDSGVMTAAMVTAPEPADDADES
jgi:peptide/nickel transport system substrate-binding protein